MNKEQGLKQMVTILSDQDELNIKENIKIILECCQATEKKLNPIEKEIIGGFITISIILNPKKRLILLEKVKELIR